MKATEQNVADVVTQERWGRQYREALFLRDEIDEAKRTVPVSFSSEQPVERWFGNEILDHNPTSVRLERLRTHGPLLFNHDPDDHLGTIESVSIDADRKGRAVVRFGGSPRAEEKFQDVKSGILKSVSFGYDIHEAVLEREQEGERDYRITDWEPYEISVVTMPADLSVGVGRQKNGPVTRVLRSAELVEPRTTTTRMETPAPPAKPTEVPDVAKIRAELQKEHREAEQSRIREITALGQTHKQIELALEYCRDGKSVDEFKSALLERVGKPAPIVKEIGLTEREAKRWSLGNVLDYLLNPSSEATRAKVAFELECSSAVEKVRGKAPTGIFMPPDVARIGKRARLARGFSSAQDALLASLMQRDITVGGTGAGLKGTDHLAGNFIDLLYASNPLMGMVTVLEGLVGDVAIPRYASGTPVYWVSSEGGSPTEGAGTFDQVTLAPKTVGTFLDISRRQQLQSNPAVEDLVLSDLYIAIGLGWGTALINGSGSSGQPLGMLGMSGIGDVAGGTNGANPTWEHIAAIVREVSEDNALAGNLAFLLNSQVIYKLSVTPKVASTDSNFIYDPEKKSLYGYPVEMTNLVPSNLTKGSASGICSAIPFGDWSGLLLGLWSGVDINLDRSTQSSSGGLRIVGLQDGDVDAKQVTRFSAMQDALTA